MKPRRAKRMQNAFTLTEVFIVMFVIAIFAMLLMPVIERSHRTKSPVDCGNNLMQLGLAMKMWAGDHNDKYPMAVSVTNGGAMELMNTPDAWKVFQVMSNELSTPRLIYCSEDSAHSRRATNFTDDLKNHISYFIGVNATAANPQSLLSGDDNFEINSNLVKSGLQELSTNAPISWTIARHNHVGNLLLSDGSVQSTTINGLRSYWQRTALPTNRLVIP